MKIIHIGLTGIFNDNWSYQDNILPKYHSRLGFSVEYIANRFIYGENQKLVMADEGEYINKDNFKVIRISSSGKKNSRSKFKKYQGLYKILLEQKPDILFVHGVQFVDISKIVKYLKKNRNVKVYVDNHADSYNSGRNWLSKNILHKIIWRHYAKKINPYVEMFYGVTPARVNFLKDIYKIPANKVELLPLGADDEEVDKALQKDVCVKKRAEYGLSEDDCIIVTGGKIDYNKPQTLLLMKAVNALKEENLKLLVFGSVAEEYKEDFEKQLSDKVRYIGWKTSAEIYKEFAVADIIAFPGLHSVLWEQAVGMGKPCIFRKIEGFEHIDLGGNCVFFETDNVGNYQKTLRYAIEHIQEMKMVATEKGRKEFSYMEIAKKSIKLSKDQNE